MSIVPRSRPQATRAEVLAFVTDGKPLPPFPFLVGRRGYYRDTMGAKGVNDIGIYDDAMFIVLEDSVATFNANCDPARHHIGMANLKVGRWKYRIGIHNLSKARDRQYHALVQADRVTVVRDGQGDDTGFFGINIHRGGNEGTSSLGCQTIPPAQWDQFLESVRVALARYGRTDIVYILTAAP